MTTELNLQEYRSAKYAANIERYGEHENTCFLCGKRTASDLYVIYTTDGKLTNDESHPQSQGCFPVGPECAKKLSATYIIK